MKIAILGSNGQLGQDLMECFPDALGLTGDDVREYIPMVQAIADYDVIVNTVAFHKPLEACEEDFRRTLITNVEFVENVAAICALHKTIFIQISTDHVFDSGNHFCYHKEDDPKNPAGLYSMTKLWAEQTIKHVDKIYGLKYYILRVAALHGKKGNNFIENIYKAINSNPTQPLEIVQDQMTCFTHCIDVGGAIYELLKENAPFGIYNCAGSYGLSFFRIAQIAMKERGVPDGLILPKQFDDKIRPQCSMMDNGKLMEFYDIPTSDECIRRYNERMKGVTW